MTNQGGDILLDRMVARLVRDNPTTSTTRELAVKSNQLMKDVRAFNDAMRKVITGAEKVTKG